MSTFLKLVIALILFFVVVAILLIAISKLV